MLATWLMLAGCWTEKLISVLLVLISRQVFLLTGTKKTDCLSVWLPVVLCRLIGPVGVFMRK